MAEVEFFGEPVPVRDKLSQYALLKFARAARNEKNGDPMIGMAGVLDLCEKVVAPDGWDTFDRLADDNDADVEQVMDFVRRAVETMQDRPTGQPSDSSDGQSITPPSSVSLPAAPVTDRLSGRPDLQLQLVRAKTA